MALQPLMVTWWSPDGWTSAPAAPEYEAFERAEEIDWTGSAERHGYDWLTQDDQDEVPLSLMIAQHRTGNHMFVMLSDYGMQSTFLVHEKDRAPFFFDKYSQLKLARATVKVSETLGAAGKALIAFVRHGHGTHVIDEWGSENQEERRNRQKLWDAKKATVAQR